MIQFYPYSGLVATLLRSVTPNLYYLVFLAPVTCSDASILSDFAGANNAYVGVVAVAAFTLQGVTGGIGKITAPDITWTNTTGSTKSVYAYFATDADSSISLSGNLVLCANFDGSPIIVPNGGTLNITPSLALGTST